MVRADKQKLWMVFVEELPRWPESQIPDRPKSAA
jgi:hypothetical protein